VIQWKSLAEVGTSKILIYSLLKNINKFKDEVDALVKAQETESSEYKEYIEKAQELSEKYGDKDENGELKLTEDKNGVIISDEENKKKLTEDIAKLDEKYADAINIRTEEIKKYNELLKEEVDITVTPIKLSEIPDNLDNNQKYALSILIDLIQA